MIGELDREANVSLFPNDGFLGVANHKRFWRRF
jgi:hypothetical protein